MSIRYRLQVVGGIFNKKTVLVLQVHKNFSDGMDDHNGLPSYLAYDTWVDATVEDLQEILKEQS